MARRKQLSKEQRYGVQALYEAGWALQTFGRDIGCSHSVVAFVPDRYYDTKSHEICSGRGRKPNILVSDHKYIRIQSLRERKKTVTHLENYLNALLVDSKKAQKHHLQNS